MARIRTIKPDFWTDGKIVQLSPFARLLYIGMWNFTLCDHGHVADDSFKLKLQILPGDAVDVDALLSELIDAGRVVRISDADGRTYLHVKRFEDHQKIDPRWKTRCPACAQQDSLEPVETHPSFGELPEAPKASPPLPLGKEGMGKEGMGKESKKTPSKPSASTDEFNAFWRDYPRKIGKETAKTAFGKALKRADFQTIMKGVVSLRAEVAGKDPKFTPYPASWLNAGRWEDEPDAPVQALIPAAYGWANR